jgi:hypothetical protein
VAQGVLKWQNLPTQLQLLADCPPVQHHPSISDLSHQVYMIDPLQGKIFGAIQTKYSDNAIIVAEITKQDGRIQHHRR